ncbi:MAG: tyrosine-type recombinase/integrase [Paenibacillaceae bacterium]
MASVEKRGINSWRLVVEAGYDSEGKRIKRYKPITIDDQALLKTTKKLKDYLNDELSKFKIEVESGEYIKPEKMTFDAFVEDWKEKYAKRGLSHLSYKTYCTNLKNHILPVFGHLRLDQIKTIHIVNFMDDLNKSGARKDGRGEFLATGTIDYIHRVLKNIFTRAKDWNLINKNPMAGVKKPKVVQADMNFYEEDEAQIVINKLYLEPKMWRMFFIGAMLGGFRRGEFVGLEWSDVNFEKNYLSVTKSISDTENSEAIIGGPKNKSSKRDVAMPEWFMAELKDYQHDYNLNKLKIINNWKGKKGTSYVFHGGYGKPLYHTSPTTWWRKFIIRHNLKFIRLHDLRHSSATLLVEAGASMKAIQKRLGHAKHQTTEDLYAHVTKKLSHETASKFDKFSPLSK